MQVIGIVSPGAMGSAVGNALRRGGARVVAAHLRKGAPELVTTLERRLANDQLHPREAHVGR